MVKNTKSKLLIILRQQTVGMMITGIEIELVGEEFPGDHLLRTVSLNHENPWIIVSKSNNKILFEISKNKINSLMSKQDNSNYNMIVQNTIKMIIDADIAYGLKPFERCLISVGDWGVGRPVESNNKFFGYCLHGEDDGYKYLCPDFTFVSWDEANYNNYDKFCRLLNHAGTKSGAKEMIIWRGCLGNNIIRQHAASLNDNDNLDIKGYWPDYVPFVESAKYANIIEKIKFREFRNNKFFISLEEMISNYRYIIDIPGIKYSGRLKLLMFSNRVVFIVDRPGKEFFMENMEPWIHYVPVKSDLSDLIINLNIIRNDKQLEKNIIRNATDFAYNNLTYNHAIQRWAKILDPEY